MPRFPTLRPTAPRVLFLLGALALASCDHEERTGPSADGTVKSGMVVTGVVGGSERRVVRLRYDAAPDEAFELQYRLQGDSTRILVVRARDTVRISSRSWDPDTALRRLRLSGGRTGATIEFLVGAPGGHGSFWFSILGQNRKPESRSAEISPGEIVEERLDTHIDADVYTFTLERPITAVAFGQLVNPGAASAGIAIHVRPVPDTSAFGWGFGMVVQARDSVAMVGGFQDIALTPGRWQLVVQHGGFMPAQSTADRPRYRVQLREVNMAPEERGSGIEAGDTITSAIDFVGDRDEFVVRAAPGDTIIAFVQPIDGMPAVSVTSTWKSGEWDAQATGVGVAGRPLIQAPTGRIPVPASGQVTLRVHGGDAFARTAGRYRLFVHRTDSLPEGREPTIAFGEHVSSRLELPGDVDVYRLVVPAATYANFIIERSTLSREDAPNLQVRRAGSNVTSASLYTNVPDMGAASGHVRLEPGTYHLRVGSWVLGADSYLGGYAIRAVAIDTLPETGPATLAIGDTVSGEITAGGDVDVFRFSGTTADTVVLRLESRESGTTSGVVAHIVNLQTGWFIRSAWVTGDSIRTTTRVQLPTDGNYAVRVDDGTDGRRYNSSGAYRASLQRFVSAPETASANVALGDTVRGESLDYAGDVDGFLLNAPPGRELVLWLRAGSGNASGAGTVVATAFDPSTGAQLGAVPSSGWDQWSGRVLVPASGRVRVRLAQWEWGCGWPGCTPDYGITGVPYTFSSYLIDRAPEGRASTLAIGDTVDERIDPMGDVDEYQLAASSGDRLLLQIALPNGGGWEGLRATALNPGTGDTLATVVKNQPGPLEGGASFTVPSTRTYVVRVEGVDPRFWSGRYQVRVLRQP